MSGGCTKYDNRYRIDEPKCIELINKIKERDHIIGFHSSYNAYNDSEQFRKEKETLENAVGKEVTVETKDIRAQQEFLPRSRVELGHVKKYQQIVWSKRFAGKSV